jgi:hypothetical protein
VDRQRTLGTVNTVSWLVGVAALGAGTAVYLTSRGGAEVAVTPLVTPAFAGLAARAPF